MPNFQINGPKHKGPLPHLNTTLIFTFMTVMSVFSSQNTQTSPLLRLFGFPALHSCVYYGVHEKHGTASEAKLNGTSGLSAVPRGEGL